LEKTDLKTSKRNISELSEIEQIMMKIERLEGRIGAMDETDKTIQERISNLSEEVGELRSSILEKEKILNQIETDAKKVTDIFEEIEPENFRKELEKKEEEILKNQAQIESLIAKYKELKENIENIQKIMEKIKSFENLVDMSEKINEKFSQIEENKKYTSRLASKVENIFSELNNRMKEFKSSVEKIEMNDETIKELMKSVDTMEIKVEKIVTKEELEKIEKEIKEEIESNKTELEDKIYDLKDFLEDIVSEAGGVNILKSKKVMPWRTEIENKMNEIEKLVKNFKPDLSATKLEREIEELKRNLKEIKSELRIKEKTVKQIETPKAKIFAKKEEEKPLIRETRTEKTIPINIENWIKENLNKGYSLDELKESLRRGGYDPSYVDIFSAKKPSGYFK